jgi:lysozyme family protein
MRFHVQLLALVLLVPGCTSILADPVDQVARWRAAKINPKDSIRLDQEVAFYQRNAYRYEAISKMRANGVPAPALFCLHMRESDNNFRCHPHEGSPLTHRTRDIPKGRLPYPKLPPFTFEESAEDAYYTVDKLDQKDWSNLQSSLDAIELFNGPGYRSPGRPPSPYLWAGTTIERPGKFVSDGRFSKTAVDGQLGCAAVLKRMQYRGIKLKFAP